MRPAPAQQPGGSCGQNAGEGPPAPVGYPGHGVTAPATGGGAARAVEAVGGRAGLARFPRIRLGHTPTPLDPAPNLGAALGIDLWSKRDDCTGLALGGNKVRRLEMHTRWD